MTARWKKPGCPTAAARWSADYERIGRLALEHVLKRPETDPDRIALMGISYGGYFATRIAAHEPRVRALIANSPIIDLHAYMTSFVGFDPSDMPDDQDVRLADIDQIPDAAIPPQTREMMRSLMLRMGQGSFKQTYQRLREFRVDDDGLRRIRCPALALVGTGEGAEPLAQAERFVQTSLREWAYARPYESSAQREAALQPFLHRYNWHRPHSALNRQPPMSRIPAMSNLLELNT